MVDVDDPAGRDRRPAGAHRAGPDFPWWNRDQCRTPMPWTAGPGAGFTTGRPWLRLGPDAATRNVAAEAADPGSVLATYRRLLAFRRRTVAALRRGSIERSTPGDAGRPRVDARSAGDAALVVAVNFGRDRRLPDPLPAMARRGGSSLGDPRLDAAGPRGWRRAS